MKDKSTSTKKKAPESKPTFIERAEKFLELWAKKDWVELIQYAQKTWNSTHAPQETHLKTQLGNYDIKSPIITGHKQIGAAMIEIQFTATVKMVVNEDKKEEEIKFLINSVCEIAPFKAHDSGEWGINPTSIRMAS